MVDERGKSHWLVTCSCGWGRECVSAWQAQVAAKLHQRLGDLDVKHAVRVEGWSRREDRSHPVLG
jgi:hypothetical protein